MDGEEAVLELGTTADEGGSGSEEVLEESVSTGDESAEPTTETPPEDGAAPKDGRYGPKEFKAHLAKIKEVDPAAAKAFERAYWKVAGVDKLGTTAELTALKEAVELHGGVEALAQMAEEVQAGRALEEGFKKGDPKVIEGWATDYPDGFKKLILPAFERLAKLDSAFHEQAAATVSTKFLENYGVFDAIGQMGEALRNGKTDDAIRLYNDLVGKVFQPMRGLATKAAENPYKDRETQLDQREQEIAEKDKKAFYGSVRSEVNSKMTTAINQELAKQLRGRKLDLEMGNRVRSEVNEEIRRMVAALPGYAQRYESALGSKDQAKAVEFIVRNASGQVSKAVLTTLKYRNLLNGNGARPAAKPAPKAGTPQAVVGRPNIADVDFGRTDKATFLGSRMHGTAWLKNGRQAKW